MDVNVATDMKGLNVSVGPTNAELEDAAKPSVQPVPESSEGVTVKLHNRTQLRVPTEKDSSASQQESDQQKKFSQKELEDAAEEIQQRLQSMGSNFKFGFYRDDESQRIVAQLRDKKTDEVIKQFPPKEILKLREKLKDLVGMILDEKV